MKIISINPIYSNLINRANTPCNSSPVDNFGITSSVKTLNTDTISFSSRKLKPIKDLRDIPGITCACCGVETIGNDEIDSFMSEKIYYPSGKAMEVIKASGVFNSKKMTKSQREAYEYCRVLSVLYPDDTMSNILDYEFISPKVRIRDKQVQEKIKEIESMCKRVYHKAPYMVKELEKFEPRMNKTEKEAFHLLKEYSKKYPNKSFTEILNEPDVFDVNLKKLEQMQGKVLWETENIGEKMSPSSRRKIHRLVTKAYNIFLKENSAIKNKRSRIIEMFEKAEANIPEKELMREVLDKINDLPSSRNNVSSFIVKYRYKNPNEIADMLLRGSSATIEHVKPQKRQNDPGPSEINNYIVLCRNCNSDRAQTPYDKFIKSHKDMPSNTQKYLDKVIQFINNGLLIGYDQYPYTITNAVSTESADQIKLDYSKLNILEAKENRKKYEKKK